MFFSYKSDYISTVYTYMYICYCDSHNHDNISTLHSAMLELWNLDLT